MMNILLILTDEQTFESLGCNGNPLVQTPHLDRLARRGVRFTRHTTSAPQCTPARASMLTGQYTRTHGAPAVGWSLDRARPTIAHCLADAGYVTGVFGKTHLEPELPGRAIATPPDKPYYGFLEHAISEDDSRGPYLDWIAREHPQYVKEVIRTTHEASPLRDRPVFLENADHPGHLGGYYPSNLPEELTQTCWIGRETRRFLDRRAADGRPFFAKVSFVQPHHPWNPIRDYLRLYDPATMPVPNRINGAHGGPGNWYSNARALSDRQLQELRAAYYAMVTQLDAEIGRILSHLDRHGLTDQTLILFTSDHGDYNTQRGMVRKGGSWYDSLLRVPLLAALPGGAGHAVYDLPTQHEDLAPTLLEAAGLPVPGQIQGRSFLGVLQGRPQSVRRWAYYDFGGTVGIADQRWKLIHYADGHMVLTDLGEDPDEDRNRIDDSDHVPIVAELKDALFHWLADTPLYRPPREADW